MITDARRESQYWLVLDSAGQLVNASTQVRRQCSGVKMLAQKVTNPHCDVRVGLFKIVFTLIIELVVSARKKRRGSLQ